MRGISERQHEQNKELHFSISLQLHYTIYVMYTANQSYCTCRHRAAEAIKSILLLKQIEECKREKEILQGVTSAQHPSFVNFIVFPAYFYAVSFFSVALSLYLPFQRHFFYFLLILLSFVPVLSFPFKPLIPVSMCSAADWTVLIFSLSNLPTFLLVSYFLSTRTLGHLRLAISITNFPNGLDSNFDENCSQIWARFLFCFFLLVLTAKE